MKGGITPTLALNYLKGSTREREEKRMTNVNYEIHSHADGPAYGWWGSVNHPAHQDPSNPNKLLADTAWHINMRADDPYILMGKLFTAGEERYSKGHTS